MKSGIYKTEARQLFTLAIPAILSQLAQMGLTVIDTMMAGRYSVEALAAIAVGINMMNPIIVTMIGIFLALNPIAAQMNGKGDYEGIRRLTQTSLFMAVVLSIPAVLLMMDMAPILTRINIEPAIIPLVSDYLHAIGFGLPGLFLFLSLRFINEGLFSNRAIMVCTLSALPLNVLLDYWFMYGGLGLPEMGVTGIGMATSLIWYFMFAMLLLYTITTRNYHHIRIFSHLVKPCLEVMKEIFKVGLPMGIGLGMQIGMFALIGLMIGSYDIVSISSHQIAINITSVAFMIPLGLSIGITARVGYHIGQQNIQTAKRVSTLGIGIALILNMMTVSVMLFLPESLVGLYTPDTAVIQVASGLLAYAAIFQFSDGIQVAATGGLRGMKDTRVPMMISGFSFMIIGLPLGYWLAEYQQLKVQGFWMAIVVALTLSAILLSYRLITRFNTLLKEIRSETEADLTTTVTDPPHKTV